MPEKARVNLTISERIPLPQTCEGAKAEGREGMNFGWFQPKHLFSFLSLGIIRYINTKR
jgi:hypothetical protein